MAGGADSDDVDGVALGLEASGQALEGGEGAEVFFFNIGDGLAVGADHVVVDVAVELDAQRAVVHADFFEDAALDEEMDVFVDRGEGDCRDAFFDSGVDFFGAGVAGHGLHDLVEHLALVGRGKAVLGAKVAERTGSGSGKGLH